MRDTTATMQRLMQKAEGMRMGHENAKRGYTRRLWAIPAEREAEEALNWPTKTQVPHPRKAQAS